MKKLYLLLACICLFAFSANAQKVVKGKVTDAAGEPLVAVNIGVKGTSSGTISDVNGNYSLSVPANGTTLVFSFVGYKTKEVAIGTQTEINVALDEDEEVLEEVVISGLASTVKRSNLANSVASIDASVIAGTTTQSTVDGALYGKFKGANIVANSGAPGGGASIKLRGVTSISGSSQPLYIIDGVYVDNSAIASGINLVSKAAAGGSQSNQDNPSNRIADLTPEDIESIEILKGASAASIYGSRSAAGVVIITTKKGEPGRTRINFEQSVGFSSMINKLGQRSWDADKAESVFGADGRADFLANGVTDYEEELYGNIGFISNTYLSVAGGSEKTRFYSSVVRKDEEGIVKNTGYEKTSLRLNLTHDISDKVELALRSNYVRSSSDRGFFNNDNSGTTMGVSFVGTPPFADLFKDANGNYPDNPYGSSNYLQTRDLVTNNETVNRFIGGATLTATLFQNETQQLKFIGSVGVDRYTLETTALFPRELQFQKNGNGTDGASLQGSTTLNNRNAQAFLVHNFFPSTDLSFTTQAGILSLNFETDGILSSATNLIGTQTNVDQAGSIQVAQTRTSEEDFGFFIQEELNYKDMFIATVGLRADKSSNNGDPNKLFFYPKANAAFNIHEMGGWDASTISKLKARVAYGQAGKFADFGFKFSSFDQTLISGLPGSLLNARRGNAAIEPEKQSELEFGFDLGLLDNRFELDVTYYSKNVTDLLLIDQFPSSSGFTQQIINGAELQNKGIEIGLTAMVVDKSDISWGTTMNFWRNRSEVTSLAVSAFNTGAFGATLGTFRIEQGKSATQIVGIDPNGDTNGLKVFGDAEPDFQLSWLNQIRFKNLELNMVWHWKEGAENVNLSTLLFDLNGTTHDYDDITLDPSGALGNGDYRISQLGTSASVFVEDASYLRLREIGLSYRLKEAQLTGFMGGFFKGAKFGVSAYNLLNFFSYNSYDPEVSNFGGGGLSTGVEVTPFPSAKKIYFHAGFTF